MKYQLVADIYHGLFSNPESVIIMESKSFEEIQECFYKAVYDYSKIHKRGEFSGCHLIVVPYSDEGDHIWPGLSQSEQSRLSKLDASIE